MADLIGPYDMVSKVKRIHCISKRKKYMYSKIYLPLASFDIQCNYVISPTPSPSNSPQAPVVPKLDNTIPLDKLISYTYPLDIVINS